MKNTFLYLLKEVQAEYSKIGSIKCPALNHDRVFFDESGFRHLLVTKGKNRSFSQQRRRFKLIHHAAKLIGLASIIDTKRVHKKKNHVFYTFSLKGNVDGVSVKVVIGRLDDGQLRFVSVMDQK